MSNYITKVTKIKDIYICQIRYLNKPIVQTKVKLRAEIGPAFRDLLRTLDKLGGDKFTSAARQRINKEGNMMLFVKHEWL
jgi:hypothetical protein